MKIMVINLTTGEKLVKRIVTRGNTYWINERQLKTIKFPEIGDEFQLIYKRNRDKELTRYKRID